MNDWLIGRDEKWDDQVFSSLNWNSLDASSFSSQAYSFYLEQTDKIEKNNKSLICIVRFHNAKKDIFYRWKPFELKQKKHSFLIYF